MTMKISARGLRFIKGFEGFVPFVYDDFVLVHGKYGEWNGGPVKGTLTIGYGHTDAARHPLKIKKGLRITEKEATDILDVDLDECEDDVNKLVKVPMTQGQFDALVSFDLNCGKGNLARLIAPMNRKDYAGTRAAFDNYIRSKGKVMDGLIRRRDGEQALWDSTERADTKQRDATTIPVPEPHETVQTPKEVERTAPVQDPIDKWVDRGAVIGPVLTGAAAGFTDWKVAAVIGGCFLVGLVILIVYKRRK